MMLKNLTAAVIAGSAVIGLLTGNIVNVYAEDIPDEQIIDGDLNGDGLLSISDAVIMQKWLHGSDEFKFADPKAIDLCRDDKIDVFDFIAMRKILLDSINIPVAVSINNMAGGFTGANTLWKVYQEDNKYILYYDYKDGFGNADTGIIEISEQDYREIMSRDYDSIIYKYDNSSTHVITDGGYKIIITYSDGSTQETSAPIAEVNFALENMKLKYIKPVNNGDLWGI